MRKTLHRWLLRHLDFLSAPRFCSNCGAQLEYSLLAKRSESSGRVTKWRWSAACPKSDVLFSGFGHWSGNGHTSSHSLSEVAGTPRWVTPMVRAMVMRRVLRSDGWMAGYGERLPASRSAR